MIIYLCTEFQSNIPILSKDIARKPFFKVENFSKLKRAITPKIIGGFYPKSNLAYILWLYTGVLNFNPIHQSFQKISHRDQMCYVQDGRKYVRTDSGDTICPSIENGGGTIKPI